MSQQILYIDNQNNDNNQTIKRQRQKSTYRKVSNETRQQLIEMVYLKEVLLKDAAKQLGINYSTAKTILRIFRMEKRVEKKNQDENKELREYINTCIVSTSSPNDTKTNEKSTDQFSFRKERLRSFDLETNLSSEDQEREVNPQIVMPNQENLAILKQIEGLNSEIKQMIDQIQACYQAVETNQKDLVKMALLSNIIMNSKN